MNSNKSPLGHSDPGQTELAGLTRKGQQHKAQFQSVANLVTRLCGLMSLATDRFY